MSEGETVTASDAPNSPRRRGRPPSGDKRGAILAAARHLMVERGYEAASVPEIAKRAGVAQGTFYRYFTGKAQLVDALTAAVGDDLNAALAGVLNGNAERPVVDLVLPMIEAALAVVESYRDVFHFLNTEALLFGRSAQAERGRAPHVRRLCDRLALDKGRGYVAADLDPLIAARLIGSVLDRVARDLLSSAPDAGKADDAARAHVVAQAVTFVRRAVAPANSRQD